MPSIKGHVTAELYLLFQRMDATGESKLALKEKARAERKPFHHYYKAKIFSFASRETYKPITQNFAHWCVDRYQINSIYQIKHSMIRDYFTEKLSHLAPNTIRTRLAAIAKLGEGIGRSESFHRVSRQLQHQLPKEPVNRPTYRGKQDQQVLEILEQTQSVYGLAMRLQLESGCRLEEMTRLRSDDLLGRIPMDGQIVGLVQVTGKGGRIRELTLAEPIYERLEQALAKGGNWLSYSGFRSAVYRASKKLRLQSGGTHKARRRSAQQTNGSTYRAGRAAGLSSHDARVEALHEANRKLGHSPARTSTTKLYLKAK